MSNLITGHLGFIGSHLVKEIDATGIDLKNGDNIITCDFPEVDTVFHLAAKTSVIESVKNPLYDAQTNILGTIRLAENYKKQRFIFASSGGAIQEKIESPYGLSKLCAEEYIKLICEDYIILRFPNIYGPGSNSVVEKFINGPVNIFGDGSSTRDYVHVDDLVRAILLSQSWQKGTYSLGFGDSTSVEELAYSTGKAVNYTEPVPGELKHSVVPNTTPDWEAKIKVTDWIKQCMT